MIGHFILLCIDEEEGTRVNIINLLQVDLLLPVAATLVEREDAAPVVVEVVLLQVLVLENHLVDQALVFAEVLFHALLDERLLDELGGVDRHVVVQEFERVVNQGGHRVLPLNALAHRFLPVAVAKAESTVSSEGRRPFGVFFDLFFLLFVYFVCSQILLLRLVVELVEGLLHKFALLGVLWLLGCWLMQSSLVLEVLDLDLVSRRKHP